MSNIIITNISLLKPNSQSMEYTSEYGKISGINTNDAPVKYLIKHLIQNKQMIDRIIAVTTNEAETALEAFKHTIEDYAKELGILLPHIEKVETNEAEFAYTIKNVTENFSPGDSAYIDTTGGFRNSSYFLMCVVRMLEYSGVKLLKAVYSKQDRDGNDNRIIDITDLYRKYDLINAVDAFTNFGNSYELERYFINTEEPAVKEVIAAMNSFSDMISLCRTSELSTILESLNLSLEKLRTIQSDSADIILFQSLINTIKDKFYMKNNVIEYPDVIRWCLDNRLIQQAVTIYVEKMPEYLFESKLISCHNHMDINKTKFNKNFDDYYNMLYNGFLQQLTSKTYSQYPLGNLLIKLKNTDKDTFKAICNSENITNLKIDNVSPEAQKGLKSLIKIKNSMYDVKVKSTENRRPEADINARKQKPHLKEFADTDLYNITAKNVEGFVNEVLAHENYLKLLQGEFTPGVPKVWSMTDVNVIEFIELVLEENKNQYRIKPDAVEKVKSILKDVIYVKRYIRNAMNHASDENNTSDEYNEYFLSQGYVVDKELNVNEIKEYLTNAINRLD